MGKFIQVIYFPIMFHHLKLVFVFLFVSNSLLTQSLIKCIYYLSCRSVAHPPVIQSCDGGATVPPIVKTEYLLCIKSCARFGLNISRYIMQTK